MIRKKSQPTIAAETYQCRECGLHYQTQKIADDCAAWCKQHQSCNLDITKLSTETKARQNNQ